MSKDQIAKDKQAAANLKARGYPHGRRFSVGLSNVPSMKETGSAAYRKMMAAKKQK